ncbi:hypothetical protein [Pseudonocardia alni]|uniref:hypothetical protein n=1 Tax=Pseudonocardia alni TaxID=33907 RepID=UPI00280BEDFE|nr:hypothetical protein [Pseudonocardia alni]
MTGNGPSAEELPDAAAARIQVACEAERMRYEEVVARDPSVKAAMEGVYGDELSACVHAVRDAYCAEGISRERAVQASEAWLLIKSGGAG